MSDSRGEDESIADEGTEGLPDQQKNIPMDDYLIFPYDSDTCEGWLDEHLEADVGGPVRSAGGKAS